MGEARLGFGIKDPDLVAALSQESPAASVLAAWGQLQLRITAYMSQRRLPDPLITSVRCLVRFDGRIVVTESPDDVNVWPGGRREPGETIRQTAVREVYEETGSRLDPTSLRLLGFLHLQHLQPPPPDYSYPHPDFLQLVFAARAWNRPGEDWRDTDGYVQRAWLETPGQARRLALDPVSLPFLDAFERIGPAAQSPPFS